MCGKRITCSENVGKSGTRAFNLKRHVQREHPEKYDNIIAADSAKSSVLVGNKPMKSQTITAFLSTKVLTTQMSKDTFQEAVVSMVVDLGIPLTSFVKPPFQTLIGWMAQKLDVSLAYEGVRNMVMASFTKAQNALKLQLLNHFVHLKIDGCTRGMVNYVAVNVRFYSSETSLPVTKTLAIVDTNHTHTSVYLAEQVKRILGKYGIAENKVLSIVSDNASNMVKLVERLNDHSKATEEFNSDNIETSSSAAHDQLEPDEEEEEEEDDNHDMALDLRETDFFDTDFEQSFGKGIEHVRCGVHTLQLAIREGLSSSNFSLFIGRARSVATSARTPSIAKVLKRRTGKVAVIDQATRDISLKHSFNMCKKLRCTYYHSYTPPPPPTKKYICYFLGEILFLNKKKTETNPLNYHL